MISESSGKRYQETRGEKLEIPVEFDQNISNLLAKIELKRQERIIRKEAELKENVENNALENAKHSVDSRQKRLNISSKNEGKQSCDKSLKENSFTNPSNSQQGGVTSGNGFTKQENNETKISPRILFFSH